MWQNVLIALIVAVSPVVPGAEPDAPRTGDTRTAAPRPIALVGTSYGRAECEHLAEAILRPRHLVFKDFGSWLPVERLNEFGMAIFCSAVDRPFTTEELRRMGDYLQDGGQVLFINSVSRSIASNRSDVSSLPWVGVKGMGWQRGGDTVTVVDAASPIVGHVRQETLEALGPIGAMARQPTTMRPLIAGGKGIVVGVNAVGKGKLWFCGPELFRLHGNIIKARADAKAKALAERIDDDYAGVLRNIILQAQTLTQEQDIAASVASLPDPVLWYRDPDEVARGAAYLQPAYPSAADILKEISLDLCQGEWESFRVDVTCRKAQPAMTVRVGDLQGPGDSRIRGADVRVRLQGLPKPELARVGPFWLLDGQPAEGGARAFDLAGNATHTFWLTLRTHGLAPGEYKGTLRFSPGGALSLRVTVWPVPLPPSSYFSVGATTHWNSLPGGDYTKKPDMALYEKYIADMGEHHISYDCPQGLTMWEGSWLLDRAVLREDGLSFPRALKDNPARFRQDKLPALDLSAFDSYCEIAGRHGLARILIPYRNRDTDFLAYTRAIYSNSTLKADSPEHARVRSWCIDELTRFFRERGYRVLCAFIQDEQPPAMIPDMTRRGKDILKHGWDPCATITGETGGHAEHYSAFNPGLSYWILNLSCVGDFWREFRTHPDMIDASDKLGTYAADWHRAPYAFNRKYGWFCPFFRLDRWMIHGYLRWYPDGGAVWPTPEGPIATEGWEGARDGIEDGRLYAMLIRLMQGLETSPAPDRTALDEKLRAAHADLDKVVGRSESCLIPLEENRRYSRAPFLEAKGRESRIREARLIVLKHLTALRPYWDFSRRSVRWGTLALAERGTARMVVIPGPFKALGDRLAARLSEMIGGPVGVAESPVASQIPVYLGACETNTALAHAVGADALGVTARYPAPGHYLMLEFAAPSGRAVALYARDEAGLEKAVDLWPSFLDVHDGLPPYDRSAFARSLPDEFLPSPTVKSGAAQPLFEGIKHE